MLKSLAYLTKLSSYLFFFPRKNKAPHNAHLNLVKYCLLLLNCVQHQTRVTVSFPFHYPTPLIQVLSFPTVHCNRSLLCGGDVEVVEEIWSSDRKLCLGLFLSWFWLCGQRCIFIWSIRQLSFMSMALLAARSLLCTKNIEDHAQEFQLQIRV